MDLRGGDGEAVGGGEGEAGGGEEGGIEVLDDDGLVADGARGDFAGPGGDEGLADAALVAGAFAGACGGVGAGHPAGDGEAAVVGHEEDEGVVGQGVGVEPVEEFAEGVVHAFDEGAVVALHGRPFHAVLGVGVAGVLGEVGGGGAGGVPGAGVVEGGVEGVVGHVEVEGAGGVLGAGAIEGAQGHVGEGVGEEDVVLVVIVLVEARGGELAVGFVAVVGVAAVVFGAADLAAGDVHVEAEVAGVGAGGGGEGGVGAVVAAGAGAPVGLAHMDGAVAGLAQELGEGEGVGVGGLEVVGHGVGGVGGGLEEAALGVGAPRRLAFALGRGAGGLEAVGRPAGREEALAVRLKAAGLVDAERPVGHAVAGGVHPAHQRAARGGADGAGVGVGEEHAAPGEALHVGRLAGVAAVQGGDHRLAVPVEEGHGGVLPAHVVDEEEDDVGAAGGARGGERPGGQRADPGAHQTQKRSARDHCHAPFTLPQVYQKRPGLIEP